MNNTPLWQTWFFGCSVLTIIGASLIFQPDITTQLLMLVPSVAILGLPHGAFDLPIAKSLWPLKGWRGHARFAFLYIGLVFTVICTWILFPGPALIAFLIYSAVHFSGDWEDTSWPLRWTGGIATVGAPALFHREEVATIFSYLAPESTANFATLLLAFSGAGALALFVPVVAYQPSLRTRTSVEQGIIWIAAACLAPLVYFIAYFCILHSVRHFTDAIFFIEHKRYAMRVAVILSIATVSVGFIGFAIMQKLGADDLEQSVLQIVFIGLAALTVPHMILVDRFHHQMKNRRSG
jgi:Brp/Blh family beta-carotene 15,15'-monooxygenase